MAGNDYTDVKRQIDAIYEITSKMSCCGLSCSKCNFDKPHPGDCDVCELIELVSKMKKKIPNPPKPVPVKPEDVRISVKGEMKKPLEVDDDTDEDYIWVKIEK